MTFKPMLFAAASASLAFAGPALAQPGAVNPMPGTAAQPTPAPDPARPNTVTTADSAGQNASATESNWIGVEVLDNKGHSVGRIERVVTGTQGGAPDQVALRVRGKTVVIPTATLTLKDGKAQSSLSLTQIEASTPDSL